MAKTEIAWTTDVWNPVLGCSRVSAGCERCYAERLAHRGLRPEHDGLTVMGKTGPRWNGKVRCLPERLETPLRWRKPRRVFVNSMSDLFHEAVPFEFVDRVFAVMALADQHTFQILTKRPARMIAYMRARLDDLKDRIDCAAGEHGACHANLEAPGRWPLPNVHLGVSVENQPTADERVSLLLQTPAAVRFVSYEPALAPVDFGLMKNAPGERMLRWHRPVRDLLNWIIVGGESGPGARPCNIYWIRSTIAQCREAGVACFVKQMGARPFSPGVGDRDAIDRINLKNLKGADPYEWPEDLRVREFPALGHGTR